MSQLHPDGALLSLLSHLIFFIAPLNSQVPVGGIVAYSMLCHLCIGYKIEMQFSVKMVSSVMPVSEVKIGPMIKVWRVAKQGRRRRK